MQLSKVKDFEELQCRKISVRLYYKMTKIARAEQWSADDEAVCRWLVSGLHISGKIAFAFWAEDYERFLEWLPLAKKYCLECAVRTDILVKKKMMKTSHATEITADLKRIVKKINAIIRYLEKYGEEEKYARQVFFDHQA